MGGTCLCQEGHRVHAEARIVVSGEVEGQLRFSGAANKETWDQRWMNMAKKKATRKRDSGGRRVTLMLDAELVQSIERRMGQSGITDLKDAIVTAVAAWVRQPKHAPSVGRPSGEQPQRKRAGTGPLSRAGYDDAIRRLFEQNPRADNDWIMWQLFQKESKGMDLDSNFPMVWLEDKDIDRIRKEVGLPKPATRKYGPGTKKGSIKRKTV